MKVTRNENGRKNPALCRTCPSFSNRYECRGYENEERGERRESALVRPVHSRFAFLQARAPRRGRGYPMAQRLTSGLPRTLLARTPFFSPPSSPLLASPFIPAKSPSPFTVPLHCPLAISFRLFERTPLATTSKSTAAQTTHRPFKRSTADPTAGSLLAAFPLHLSENLPFFFFSSPKIFYYSSTSVSFLDLLAILERKGELTSLISLRRRFLSFYFLRLKEQGSFGFLWIPRERSLDLRRAVVSFHFHFFLLFNMRMGNLCGKWFAMSWSQGDL